LRRSNDDEFEKKVVMNSELRKEAPHVKRGVMKSKNNKRGITAYFCS